MITNNATLSFTEDQPDLANILVVDDLEADIELTRILLVRRGKLQCNLLVAQSADQALRMLEGGSNDGMQIDLMLLDINMPGMDGFELMETLRQSEAGQNTAVVMCTGSAYQKDEERAAALGSVGYLVKPLSFDKLKMLLHRIPKLHLEEGAEGNRLMRTA